MPDDLVVWLRAQLDEDERVARAAHLTLSDWTGLADALWKNDVYDRDAAWDFIEANNPARVLAEIEAKRRIIRAHDVHCDRRCDEARYDAHAAHWWSVKVLALPYADRPGYREEWKP